MLSTSCGGQGQVLRGALPDDRFPLVLQISPFILSTVMTITAAMRAKAEQQKEEVQLDAGDLWSVSNVYNCNYWFLGVEEATEVTESFREAGFCNEGESFSAQIKVPHITFKMLVRSLHTRHICRCFSKLLHACFSLSATQL